jgi:hypothetical protein
LAALGPDNVILPRFGLADVRPELKTGDRHGLLALSRDVTATENAQDINQLGFFSIYSGIYSNNLMNKISHPWSIAFGSFYHIPDKPLRGIVVCPKTLFFPCIFCPRFL